MKQSHPPAYEQSPAKRLRAAGAVQQPRPSLSLLFATPLGFFVTCLMLLIREAHVSPRVSVAHSLRPACDLVVITEGRKEQIYCADSGSLVARDFDWMTLQVEKIQTPGDVKVRHGHFHDLSRP